MDDFQPIEFDPFQPFKPMNPGERPRLDPPFAGYDLDPAFFDEMFTPDGVTRPSYKALHQRIHNILPAELKNHQRAADASFLDQGITFTVYGNDGGTERIFPYDLLPRMITSKEWDIVSSGLEQRVRRINLFLKDIYGEGRILRERGLPRELVYTCKHYRREMRGVRPPNDVWVSLCGTDLIRTPDGTWTVLEDNLRVPSGRFLYADQSQRGQRSVATPVPRLRRAPD